jgi:hypothetical protein
MTPALLSLVEAFCETVEAEERHRARGPGGQQVTNTHDFASAPPSTMARLSWWARAMRSASAQTRPASGDGEG